MNIIKKINLRKFLQKYGCEHEYEFVRNIYGDEINQVGGYRSIWKCTKCGHIQYREDLYKAHRLCDELDKLYDNHYKDKYQKWCSEHSTILNSLIDQMKENAYSGYDYLTTILYINNDNNDRNYYEKWFIKNGLKYSRESITKEDVKIKQYRYTITWKNNKY